MDQLKTQLAAVKQHSFWVMCLGILGVSLGSWWVSTSKLDGEQSAQVGKIKGGKSAVQQAGVLVWPASFEQTGFRAYVDKSRPIEKVPVDATGKVSAKEDMPSTYR